MKYFTIEELSHTNSGLDNTPGEVEIENLTFLTEEVLDVARGAYGKPIHINSGYRSPKVNKKVGGVSTSQHVRGQAADIDAGSIEENKKLFKIIKNLGKYDQLINEHNFSWIHVSYTKDHNRKELIAIK